MAEMFPSWSVVTSKKKKRRVIGCKISKSLELHESVMKADVMPVPIVENEMLDILVSGLGSRDVGDMYMITVYTDQQYLITILENTRKLTILNQQYVHRDNMRGNVRKFQYREINKRKVCIYWR